MRAVAITVLSGIVGMACAAGSSAAHLTTDSDTDATGTQPSSYVVRAGDTLYSIAWRHDLDYRDLQKWNNIGASRVTIGQVLILHPPAATPTPSVAPSTPAFPPASPASPASPRGVAHVGKPIPLDEPAGTASGLPGASTAASTPASPAAPPAKPPAVSPTVPSAKPWVASPVAPPSVPPTKAAAVKPDVPPAVAESSSGPAAPAVPVPPQPRGAARDLPSAKGPGSAKWLWPTARASAPRAVPGGGILLFGRLGQDVVAASAGRVVYTGSGIRGYGNLIIIKHADNLLSSYAHNREILVREGQDVGAGQLVARMGMGPHQVSALYFEIRVNGKPTDPTRYLPPVR